MSTKDKKEKKNKDDKEDKSVSFKKKKKKGHACCIRWDNDASSSEDEKTPTKLASVAINKASLFNSPSCFVAKGPKVQYDSDGGDS
jgi:hypothetical protein